jgi:hypothetical protein
MANSSFKIQWNPENSAPVKELLNRMEGNLDVIALALQRSIVASMLSPPPQMKKDGSGFRKNSSKSWKRAHHATGTEPPFRQTGHLVRNVGIDKPIPLIRRVGIGVGSKEKVRYGWWQEFGWRDRPTGRFHIHPFIRPSLDKLWGFFYSRMRHP